MHDAGRFKLPFVVIRKFMKSFSLRFIRNKGQQQEMYIRCLQKCCCSSCDLQSLGQALQQKLTNPTFFNSTFYFFKELPQLIFPHKKSFKVQIFLFVSASLTDIEGDLRRNLGKFKRVSIALWAGEPCLLQNCQQQASKSRSQGKDNNFKISKQF